MFNQNFKRKLKELGLPTLFFIGGIFVWEIIVLIFKIPEYFLPSPSMILKEIITNFNFLLSQLSITMFEAVVGFVIANILGFIVAVIFVHSKTIEGGLYPYALALKMTPIVAIAPFLIIWFGVGIISKIATVIIICFFPILVNAIKGLRTIDNEALDLFKSLSASKWQIFLKLRLPSSLSYVFPALKTSTALSIVGALVGEFVGGNQGIGYIILFYSTLFETTKAFSAIVMIVFVGILFFWFISLIEKKVMRLQKLEEEK